VSKALAADLPGPEKLTLVALASHARADVLGIAARLVAAEMSYTSDVDSQDWHLVAEGWYRSLMSIPSWSQDLHDGGSEE